MSLGFYCFLIFVVCCAAPVAAIYVIVHSRRVRKIRRPIRSHILRTAGHSLSDRIAELNDKLVFAILIAMAVPLAVAVATVLQINFAQPVPADRAGAGFFFALLFAIPAGWYVIRLTLRFSDYRLGLSGERAVAEHLQDLVRAGCYVFHDLAPSKTWNIDHIVVAPESVLVIETKTRRMRTAPAGRRDHEAVFDGTTVHFPHYSDRDCLDQAVRNADYIRKFLSEALCEPVKVDPVVAIPGWWVERKGRGKVYVVNPKQIRALVRVRGAHVITPAVAKRMGQIAFALELKCRDVEF